jgi:hypothetical protein
MDWKSRRVWQQATSLTDLGALMATWLEGGLASRPGYQARCAPDDETRELIPSLAAACRAGFVTTDSQPGLDEHARGRHWRQRAAVQGYVADAALLRALTAAASRNGCRVIAHTRHHLDREPWVEVTTVDGEVVTAFGERMSRPHLKVQWSGIDRAAFTAVEAAWQVCIYHPAWGPSGTRPLINTLTAARTVRAA